MTKGIVICWPLIWVLWMEKHRRSFERYIGAAVEELWESRIVVYFLASVPVALKDYSFFCYARL